MKINAPDTEVIARAAQGDLAALDALLLAIQPGVYNLAVRMLGNRDDAADATQEILLKVVTHLGGFGGRSAFTTWVFQIARNHLLTAWTRSRESPEVSLEALGERLQQGLEFTASLGDPHGGSRTLTPEDKLAARQVALGCTQNMLMALDRGQRLVYVLDAVFGLASPEAAEVLAITPEAYRQRLARARARLDSFANGTCGQVNREAACQCERQLPALAHLQKQAPTSSAAHPPSLVAVHRRERAEAERQFEALVRMGDAAAVFRAHPRYEAPDAIVQSIRVVLKAEGYLGNDPAAH
jgi:RNA polymerase sigma factor (sigma-70 family)